MRNTLETRLGLFFALAIIAAVIIFELIGGLDFFRAGHPVRARFGNIQELKVGDPVRMAGVQIGQVENIALRENRVEVTMKLTKPEMVKTDSVASVRFVGLMGQNYVAIDFGSPHAPQAAADALLETQEVTDLSNIMVKLESVATGIEDITRTFSPDMLQNLIGPFTDFLHENSPRLTAMIEDMQSVSSRIAAGEGTMGKLMVDEALYSQALEAATKLNDLSDDLKGTVAQARTVVDNINAGQGTLGLLAHDEELYREAALAMNNLRGVLEKINLGEGSVGALVNDPALYRNARMTLQKLDKATEGLEDQGPLSVLGIAVNSLF
jgi:phospholipid/cholesterol/gamma-HCH transport system substrate-binding protein